LLRSSATSCDRRATCCCTAQQNSVRNKLIVRHQSYGMPDLLPVFESEQPCIDNINADTYIGPKVSFPQALNALCDAWRVPASPGESQPVPTIRHSSARHASCSAAQRVWKRRLQTSEFEFAVPRNVYHIISETIESSRQLIDLLLSDNPSCVIQ